MPIFALKSEAKTCALENAEADYRTAQKAEQFRVGKEALYFAAFPGTRYIPFAAVTRALVKNTAISLTGSCGKQLPMVLVRTYYDGEEFYHNFLFEKGKNAAIAVEALKAARPDLNVEQDDKPWF